MMLILVSCPGRDIGSVKDKPFYCMSSDISLPYQEQICDGSYDDDDADDDNANNTDDTDEERVGRRQQY